MSKEPRGHSNPIRLEGVVAILAGLVLVCTSLLIDDDEGRRHIVHAFVELLEMVGIGIFGLGLFGILLDTASWREYFAQRLRDVVLEQSYLDELDESTLAELQTKTLKAVFKDPQIDKEGSFLNYFNSSLHAFISSPYREDVTAEVHVSRIDERAFHVLDDLSYTCRAANGQIQEYVKWSPDRDEFISISSVKVTITFPAHHHRRDTLVVLYDETDRSTLPTASNPLSLSLDGYRSIDYLQVRVQAEYVIASDRFHHWEMAHPTRNFDFLLRYPDGLTAQVTPLVLHPKLALRSDQAGVSRVRYNSWMLPHSGVAWRVYRETAAASGVSEGSAISGNVSG